MGRWYSELNGHVRIIGSCLSTRVLPDSKLAEQHAIKILADAVFDTFQVCLLDTGRGWRVGLIIRL